jgi:hypothetical protein
VGNLTKTEGSRWFKSSPLQQGQTKPQLARVLDHGVEELARDLVRQQSRLIVNRTIRIRLLLEIRSMTCFARTATSSKNAFKPEFPF